RGRCKLAGRAAAREPSLRLLPARGTAGPDRSVPDSPSGRGGLYPEVRIAPAASGLGQTRFTRCARRMGGRFSRRIHTAEHGGRGLLAEVSDSVRSQFEIGLAALKDDSEFSALLRRIVIPGAIQVTFEREPRFFDSCKLHGSLCQVVVGRD